MKLIYRLLSFLFLLGFSSFAFAQDDQFPNLMNQYKQISGNINNDLIKPALMLAASALSLQWILSHWRDIYTGDITGLLAKMVGVVSWGGVTFWLLQHQDLLSSTFSGYLKMAGIVSGIGEAGFDPGEIVAQGIDLIQRINNAFTKGIGFTINPAEIANNMLLALLLVFANIVAFFAYLIVALSVFVCQTEFWLMFAVAPLAFALIPLSAFREQGIAPVKGVISLGLRIIILAVVVRVTNDLTDNLAAALSGTKESSENFFSPILFYLAGMCASAIMAFSAGKIASSIASGSASFSGADAIKGGMQLATSAAVGAGAVAAVGAAAGNTASAATKGLEAAGSGLGNSIGSMRNANNLGVAPGAPNAGGGGGLGGPMPKDPSEILEATYKAANPTDSGSANDAGSSANDAGAGNNANSGGSSSASSSYIAGNSGKSGAAPASQTSTSAANNDSSKSSSAAANGNASSASIGGSQDHGQQKNQSSEQPQNRKRSFGDQIERAAEHTSQDNHAVSVSINLRGE